MEVMRAPSHELICPSMPSMGNQFNLSNQSNYKIAENRLRTFENWPVGFINKIELAADGFYYTNDRDFVTCAFCNKEMGNWISGDDVRTEHSRNSPDCPFVNGLICGNIPWTLENVYEIKLEPKKKKEKGFTINKEYIFDPKAAIHPQFSVLKDRLDTFKDWPISLNQKPAELAEAGFVYNGKGDQTICHYCNVGLNNWEPEDMPWIEHEKANPDCEFLKFTKPTRVHTLTNEHFSKDRKTKRGEDAKNDQLQLDENLKGNFCKVCYTNETNVVFLPCRHLVACTTCAIELEKCPICRSQIEGYMRTYLA